MATYQYKARDKFGKLVQGKMGAVSEKAVAQKLEQMHYVPINILLAKSDSKIDQFFSRFKRVRFVDLNMFTRQLYTLQKAGLPILSSLFSLREQTTDLTLKDVIGQIIRDIESGSNFSDALARHPKVFNALYTNMIRSGEVSGRLAETLDRLATLGEHEEVIRMRIQAAMRYPIIVITAIAIGFTVLITFVVPKYSHIYNKFDTALPMPTRILLAVNYIVSHFWLLIILIVLGGAYLFLKYINTKLGRHWLDSIILKLPVFGPLIFDLLISRFCRITATLLKSGVPILQILTLVSEGIGNLIIASTIDKIKDSVKEGKGMLEPMKQSGMFPPIVTQMVAVGESTGKLDELLLHVSDYYDAQVDHTIKNLISLIEPILIFVLAVAVLFMALGIFLPMWNLMQLFKK